jgi:hypothetical protein
MSNTQLALKDSAALAQLNEKMAGLAKRAEGLEKIEGPAAIGTAKTLEADLKAYCKAVEFQTQPDIVGKKEELRLLQTNEAELLKPAEDILGPLTKRRKAAEMEERRKADAEAERLRREAVDRQREQADKERREAEERATKVREDRVEEIRGMLRRGEVGKRESARLLKLAGANEEAAKADAAAAAEELANRPAPKIEVKADIPTVAGTKSQVYWKFRIVQPALVPLTFRCIDEQAIGKMVRDTKNQKEAEKLCPGIEVWSE